MKYFKYVIPLNFMLFAGCHGASKTGPMSVIEAVRPDTLVLNINWNRKYSKEANLATTETYSCISEMYSLAYSPVNAGPVCREACAQMDKVNAMVTSAPSSVQNPEQYRIKKEKGDICDLPQKRKQAKP